MRSEEVDVLEHEVFLELLAVEATFLDRTRRVVSLSPSVSLDVCELGGDA